MRHSERIIKPGRGIRSASDYHGHSNQETWWYMLHYGNDINWEDLLNDVASPGDSKTVARDKLIKHLKAELLQDAEKFGNSNFFADVADVAARAVDFYDVVDSASAEIEAFLGDDGEDGGRGRSARRPRHSTRRLGEYQGWSNWETWSYNQYYGDQDWSGLVDSVYEDGDDYGDVKSKIVGQMKDDLYEEQDNLGESGFFADAFSRAVTQVDFDEVVSASSDEIQKALDEKGGGEGRTASTRRGRIRRESGFGFDKETNGPKILRILDDDPMTFDDLAVRLFDYSTASDRGAKAVLRKVLDELKAERKVRVSGGLWQSTLTPDQRWEIWHEDEVRYNKKSRTSSCRQSTDSGTSFAQSEHYRSAHEKHKKKRAAIFRSLIVGLGKLWNHSHYGRLHKGMEPRNEQEMRRSWREFDEIFSDTVSEFKEQLEDAEKAYLNDYKDGMALYTAAHNNPKTDA